MKHDPILISKIKDLRSEGKTYGEINKVLRIKLAKSTLHWICKDTPLPSEYLQKISQLNIRNLGLARATAAMMNKLKKEKMLKEIYETNLPISQSIHVRNTAKIALAMLCLGEASKSNHGSSFSLGNSDPRIICLFLKLLNICFKLHSEKITCKVQHRTDQNTKELEAFWSKETGIPLTQFRKAFIDPRTIGKPTKRRDYKGVLRVDYFQRHVQLELESLAQLIYNQLQGPVV